MVYKGYELLKAIANNEIKEGSKFKDSWGAEYIYKEAPLTSELGLYRIEGDKIIVPDYSFFADNENDFELIEDEMYNIEELTNEVEGTAAEFYAIKNKINELVQVVNQLNKKVKQLEEDK